MPSCSAGGICTFRTSKSAYYTDYIQRAQHFGHDSSHLFLMNSGVVRACARNCAIECPDAGKYRHELMLVAVYPWPPHGHGEQVLTSKLVHQLSPSCQRLVRPISTGTEHPHLDLWRLTVALNYDFTHGICLSLARCSREVAFYNDVDKSPDSLSLEVNPSPVTAMVNHYKEYQVHC